MIKQRMSMTLVTILWGLALTVLGLAQQPTKSTGQQQPQQRGREKMSMDDMMKQCRTHCQETSSSIDQLMKTMQEARQSNDPAKMRSALEQAEKPLAEMKNHMNMCMNMMTMMENMHGGRGGPMKGMMQGSQGAAAKETDPVCRMEVDPKSAPKATYQGKTYYFCSEADKQEFEQNPEQYLKK